MKEQARIGVTRWGDMSLDRIRPYWERLREAGAEVIDLADAEASSKQIDGLILTGGLDIDPSRYGEEADPTVGKVDAKRDSFEFGVLDDALRRDLPVLAICRGHQLLNVAFGGSLLQHIERGDHVAHLKTEGRPSRWHDVCLGEGSELADILGATRLDVNSRHHQAVTEDTLGSGLRAVAWSPDGLIEAVQSKGHRWVLGVQWHPERPEPEHPNFGRTSGRLFKTLVQKVTSSAHR